jgi:hypothetical protein
MRVWILASDPKERLRIEWISKRCRQEYADLKEEKHQKDVRNRTVRSFITLGQQIKKNEGIWRVWKYRPTSS